MLLLWRPAATYVSDCYQFDADYNGSPDQRLNHHDNDFGFKRFYVGAMKGAMYKVFPQAKIDEISHGVSKFDIKEGAYTLAKAAPEFPTGTVFVGVIDPGVGTQRKPIAMKTKNGNYFVCGRITDS